MSMFSLSTNDSHSCNSHLNKPSSLVVYYNQYMVVVVHHHLELIEAIYKPDHPNEDNHILAQWQMA